MNDVLYRPSVLLPFLGIFVICAQDEISLNNKLFSKKKKRSEIKHPFNCLHVICNSSS